MLMLRFGSWLKNLVCVFLLKTVGPLREQEWSGMHLATGDVARSGGDARWLASLYSPNFSQSNYHYLYRL